MSDKTKQFIAPPVKVTKPRVPRPSTVGVASTSSRDSRVKVPQSVKIKPPQRLKVNKNATIISEADVTMKQEGSLPDFDAEHRQIAYGKFLRAMLEECLVDEKIEREDTQIDVQMAQLADRFQATMDMLDKTNRRLKDVSFVVEQKRLLDLKNTDSTRFYEMTDNSNAQELLNNLKATEQDYLNKLGTKNIDFGFNKDSGHKQLLDAVNDAILGLDQIKRHSNLDINKFKEYDNSQKALEELEKDKLDLESLKLNFEERFPKFSKDLLMEASEKIASMLDNEIEFDED